MNAIQEIESGNFAVPRWLFFPPDSMRVVNWNIDRGLKLSGVIEFLAGAKADIILLQEVDLNARRTHHINVASEIAQKLEMNYVFGREFQELTQGSKSSPAYHGQATLSRWPLSDCRIIRFRKQSHFWHPHWFLPEIAPFQERLGGRLALVSEANIAGKTIVTYNLHLESRGDDQLRYFQLDEVLDDARRYNSNTPILLTGDFNLDVSGGPAAAAIGRAEFQDAFAKPTRANDTWLILGARANHRLGLYARTHTCRPAPSPSFGFSFRPLSAVRQANDWLAPECQFSVHRRAGRKPLQRVTRTEARGRLGSRAGRQFDTTDCERSRQRRMCNSRKTRIAITIRIAHVTIKVLDVVSLFCEFLEIKRSSIDVHFVIAWPMYDFARIGAPFR